MSLQKDFVTIVEKKLGQAFADKFLTLAAVRVGSAEQFCERAKKVHNSVQTMAERVRVDVTKTANQFYTHDMSQHRGEKPQIRKRRFASVVVARQKAQFMVKIVVGQEVERCVREWSCLALTTLIYDEYVARSPHKRLSDVPLALMEVWMRDLRARLAPAIEASHCDVHDFSTVFERALMHRHMSFLPCVLQTDQAGLLRDASARGASQSMSLEEFRKFAAENPQAAGKRIRRASRVCVEMTLTCERVMKNDDALAHYSAVCVAEMAHFVSGMTNEADRYNLSSANLLVLWRFYLFVVLQRGGVGISENAYEEHMRAQTDLFSQYAPLRASVLALRTRVENCLDDWQRENLFFCGPELRALWINRCNCVLQGLDAAHFTQRMVRQEMARRLAMTVMVPATMLSANKVRSQQNAVMKMTPSGKWQRIGDSIDSSTQFSEPESVEE